MENTVLHPIHETSDFGAAFHQLYLSLTAEF